MKTIYKVLATLILISALAGCNANNSTDDSSKNNVSSESGTNDASSNSSINDGWDGIETESNPDSSNSSEAEDGSNQENNESTEVIDPTAPTVYLESTRDGNTITVRMMVKNNPGIAAYTINVKFDKEKVTPKTITAGISSPIVSNLQQPNITLSGSNISAVYANTKGFALDGEMFNITFDINATATGEAKFEIVAKEKDFVAPDYAYIIFQKQDTKINVS